MAWTPEVRYIASIYPGVLQPQTYSHGDSRNKAEGRAKRYWMPSVPRGKEPELPKEWIRKTPRNCAPIQIAKVDAGQWAAVLQVSDGWESVPDPYRGSGATSDKMVDADETVDNLLKMWAGNLIGMPVGATPGIMRISNTAPTQDEYRRMLAAQTLFYEHQFALAEQLALANDLKSITQLMKDSALWLGQDRRWSSTQISASHEHCAACGALKPADKPICQTCGTRVKALPADLEALNVQQVSQAPKPQPVAV